MQNVTLAAVLKPDPVADRATGCPRYEKIALCRAAKIDPAGPMTLLLCLAKSLMSVIYLVQKSLSKSFFHAVNNVQKPPQEIWIIWKAYAKLLLVSAVYQANKPSQQ